MLTGSECHGAVGQVCDASVEADAACGCCSAETFSMSTRRWVTITKHADCQSLLNTVDLEQVPQQSPISASTSIYNVCTLIWLCDENQLFEERLDPISDSDVDVCFEPPLL